MNRIGSGSLAPRRAKQVIWKVIDEKGILLNLEDGSYFEVDPVGLAIWEKCDGRTPLSEIAAAVAGEFSADHRRVSSDADFFVSQLQRGKLVD